MKDGQIDPGFMQVAKHYGLDYNPHNNGRLYDVILNRCSCKRTGEHRKRTYIHYKGEGQLVEIVRVAYALARYDRNIPEHVADDFALEHDIEDKHKTMFGWVTSSSTPEPTNDL